MLSACKRQVAKYQSFSSQTIVIGNYATSFGFLPLCINGESALKLQAPFYHGFSLAMLVKPFCIMYLGHHPWHNYKSTSHNLPDQSFTRSDIDNAMKDSYFPKTGCLLTPHLIQNNVELVLESEPESIPDWVDISY